MVDPVLIIVGILTVISLAVVVYHEYTAGKLAKLISLPAIHKDVSALIARLDGAEDVAKQKVKDLTAEAAVHQNTAAHAASMASALNAAQITVLDGPPVPKA